MRRILTYGTYDLLHYGHIRLLKRAKEQGDYLIVAISTEEFNAIKGKKEEYLALGFDDYLSKPIDTEELSKTLKKYLKD